jgi:hypothetical protein
MSTYDQRMGAKRVGTDPRVTPSAKAHERVTGRWLQDIVVENGKDRFAYYLKSFVGTPIPWLFSALVILSFFSRAGSEIAAWLCTILTLTYIAADRLARPREFSFFRVGSDIFLIGLVLITIITACNAATMSDAVSTLGDARWILLLYSLAYCWELFPGLNRIFFLMLSAASALSVYGIWQHFTGVDPFRGVDLAGAPVKHFAYFIPTGFFSSPEVFGTVLATVLPFSAATFLLSDRKDEWYERWLPLACTFLLGLAVFWTYRPGLWLAAFVGVAFTLLMKARSWFFLLASATIFFGTVMLVTYAGSPGEMLDGVHQAEEVRADRQREQLKAQTELWKNAMWVGVGHDAVRADHYDSSSGNVYFQILAQSGLLGGAFYLLFIVSFLLMSYRMYAEIPESHFWHRVLISGGVGSQIAFHACGLYWSTMTEAITLNLFILILSAVSYVSEHYSRGLVTDDVSL